MKFIEALKQMQEGKKVKLPSWGGYWYWDDQEKTVMIHCKDDTVLDIRETQAVEYTLLNVCSDEWIVAEEENTSILGGNDTFNFVEAVRFSVDEILPDWFLDRMIDNTIITHENGTCDVYTLDGNKKVNKGDYIILGTDGNLSVCKKNKFEKEYVRNKK